MTLDRIALPLALALCGAWLLAALLATAGAPLLTPDSLHYALVARNLLAGRGYVIEVVPFHPGWFDSVTRLPEMHGLLRPVVLAPFFAVLGFEDTAVRIPGLVYVALTGWVAFAFARSNFGAGAGLLACLLTLGSGMLCWYGWAGTDDVGFAFYFVWALHCFDRALDSGRAGWFAWAGVATGLGLLEKLTGLLLLPVFACAWLLFRDAPGRATPRRVVLALAPFALALGLYVARNLAAHGGPGFRFSPLAWMLKTRGYEGFFALYERAPTLGWVVSELGWKALPGIALGEVAKLVEHVFRWPSAANALAAPQGLTPLALGLPSILVHARRHARFAALCGLAVLGSVVFVCGFHHVEDRYFAMLIPLLWVSLAGAVADGWRTRVGGWRGRAARGAALAGLGAALALAAPVVPAMLARAALVRYAPAPCGAAFDWLRQHSEPGDRVLAFNPWLVAWYSGREAVKVPSGGRAEIERVVQHYGTRWILITPTFSLRGTQHELRAMAARPSPGFHASRVSASEGCQLFELRPAPVAAQGAT